MRPISTLILFLISFCVLDAQVTLEEYPLDSNPVLQKEASRQSKANQAKLLRLFGAATTESRTVNNDCENDGDYENGQTAYLLSGDTLVICLDTTGFVSFTDLSVSGNFGNLTIDSTCLTYIADTGVELGIGDTLRVENCLSSGNCLTSEYPVVVIRENENFIEAPTVLNTETDATLCVSPANYILPDEITGSSILDCHDTNLASASNGSGQDSCLLLTAKRFAGLDTVCLTISNDYCITDTYKFPYQVIGDTLELPFMDDFSYDGPFPNNHWVTKDAYVNNHWGYQPPSVGFATMDGLDETGTPYGGGYGRADFLTSNYLDLSPYSSSSNVYFTCYAQPKGYGLPPNESDSLVVEFKKSNGEWVKVHAFQGLIGNIDNDFLPAFDDYFSFAVISSSYLYNGFQFRFVNYAQRTGIRDIWHIDYVRLTANEIPDGTFEDIAFTNIPNDLLKRYSSMPWTHFENSMLIDQVDIELFSQFETTETADPSGITISELETGTIALDLPVLLLTDAIAPENQRNVPSLTHKFHTNPLDLPGLPGLSGDKFVFETEYHFEVNAENPGTFPQVDDNNSVRSLTVFDNYFAYDDGSAESSMKVGDDQGEAVAAAYTATVPDTLRAVQIHFPHYTAQNNARFNLKVHIGSLGNDPVYQKFAVKPFFADQVLDTLQGYTTYRLTDDNGDPSPIAIPVGDFFIELEQGSGTQLTRIGLDKNTPEASEYQSFKLFGEWVGLGNNGAMMVRPVVGSFTPGNTPVNELSAEDIGIKLFPNPSNGMLQLEMNENQVNDFEIFVFNNLGQLMFTTSLSDNYLDLTTLDNGMFYLKIKNTKTNQIATEKITIFK